MSGLERTPPGPQSGGEAPEDEVRRLLRAAGRRPEIPQEDLAIITAAARATWRQQVAPPARRARRARWPLALAAAVVATVGALLWWGGLGVFNLTQPATSVVAEAQRVWGQAWIEAVEGEEGEEGRSAVAEGQTLTAGSLIATTGDGNRVALLLDGGSSLRLDHGSRLRLISATAFRLEAGAVYIDTGLEDRTAVAVHTAFGTVTDIGTQFSVRLPQEQSADGALQVRVRQGEVRVTAATADPHEVQAGTELLLTAQGAGSKRQIAAYGPEWDWTLDAAPSLDVEGLNLADFLDWVARETGWAVRIEDSSLAAAAEGIVLHGTTGSLRPDRAALAALASAGLRGEVANGTLSIRRARP